MLLKRCVNKMAPVSLSPHERARKSYSTVLRALQEPGRQVAAATAMGVSESTVSRIKTDQIEQVCLLLACVGLKVIPTSMECVPVEQMQALLTLARTHLNQIERPDQLYWE